MKPAQRLRALRQALASGRDAGRYARVSALDGLLELAADPTLRRSCLRVALEHLDAMGAAVSEIEIDRVRTLRDLAYPQLVRGAPLDAAAPPTELDRRAAAALEGLVRGPIPAAGDPDHAEALALTALAHLIAQRLDAALPLLAHLSALSTLPRSAWAVLIEACRTPRARRATHELARRLATERPGDAPLRLLDVAPHVDARAQTTLLLAAFEGNEAGATEALERQLEALALAKRDAGDRAGAIALLEAFEAAALTGQTAALKRCLDAT